ncbi:peptide-methionine (S)-S-oxide reductase MsrA [Saccharibacillus kuerlensis]|uniref:peptide-methionine (S)-S-oxide reductase n=1 Tax=Saccharibacillus kuerlensis TaxID=459527 RepID=A0ABQ2L5Y5_9BACL|nr:peptide-methionine (S)-S-oxide reductase [Saccharibacillus kuerlensis]GGO04720.1 peptide methionine sulfoxide reductase MsrA [Saccharibacillus kuerlensis]
MPEEEPIREKLTFAMGCFWGPEDRFARLPGVTATRVGYSGSQPLPAPDTGSANAAFPARDGSRITDESDHQPSSPSDSLILRTADIPRVPTHRRLEGHSETVEVEFDPGVVSLEELLEKFWSMHNPQAIEGYKPEDSRYRSLLFYRDEQQRELMERVRREMAAKGRNSEATALLPVGPFYPAEEKHQRYEEKKRERNRAKL